VVNLWGVNPEVEATYRGQLEMVNNKGRQIIVGVCWYSGMLHSVYAALIDNSQRSYGEIERDESTLCSCKLVLAMVPVLDPAGIIGLRGNSLTLSNIVDFSSEPSL
jgi:hypothetical protein